MIGKQIFFMKHVILSFTLLFIFFAAKAQLSVNVFWTEQSGLNPQEIIYYNPMKNLVWPDFKGTPGPPSAVAAITSSGFGYKANMQSSGGKGQINISVYCYFSKDKSWVKPGKTTAYILNHEQHHFDVSFLAAGIFMEKVKSANLTLSNCNTLLPKLYKECCEFMNKMQDDYDGQTKNGQLADQQAKWNKFFNERVSLVTR
jgi:hypothetical protein